MGETYYDVLGVDRDATQDEIRSAYRDRVLETHPDHNDDPDAADQFKRVSTAESVLTDDAERARYDRLGHESYVRLAENGGGDSSQSDEREDEGRSTASGTARAASRTRNTGRSRSGDADWADAGSESRGRSHHARQRSRRRRQTAAHRSSDGWPFDTDRTTGADRTEANPTTDRSADESEFSYDVHDWDEEIDWEPEPHRLDQPTMISLGSITASYPLFVYASLTPAFSLPTNVVVAACTLVLIGYMLTFPRVAVAAFGGWSVVLPVALYAGPIDPLSLLGLSTIAFAWVPFGYAVAVWWVLRP